MQRDYRFSLNNEDSLETESITVYNKDLQHQIINVLRIKPGHKEKIDFINGTGIVYEAMMTTKDHKSIRFQITQAYKSLREPKQKIKFFIPLIKKEAFLIMVQKLTELGIEELIPVKFSRSQLKNIESFNKTKTFKIIKEATEQCGGAIYTKLCEVISFEEIQKHIHGSKAYYASERLSLDAIQNPNTTKDNLSLLVGPEGGLSDEEVLSLNNWGFQALSLGQRLLKAETAAIKLSSICQV